MNDPRLGDLLAAALPAWDWRDVRHVGWVGSTDTQIACVTRRTFALGPRKAALTVLLLPHLPEAHRLRGRGWRERLVAALVGRVG